MAGKIRLGELLVRAGVLDELKLKAALAEQQRWGGRLGRILIDMNFVSEDLLTKALSKQLGFPRATFADMNIPDSVLAKIPADFARSNACCPEHFDPSRKLLMVAMADPTNVPVTDELRFKTGLRVEATIAGEVQISMAIDHLYGTRSGSYAAQSPDAIDLPPDDDRLVFAPSQAYVAAMAASGLTVGSGSPDASTHHLSPASGHHPAPAQAPAAAVPSTGPLELNLSTGPLDVAATNGYGAASPAELSSQTPDGVAQRLDAAQRQQHRAVQVMIDLLIEKGVFTREEFAQMINRRGQ